MTLALALGLTVAGCGGTEGAPPGAPVLEVSGVVAPAPAPNGTAAPPIAVYFFVMNTGAGADTLDAVEVAGGVASIHDQVPATATRRASMVRIEAASIPAGEMLRFIPGGRHVMIEGLEAPPAPGDTLALTMVFRRAGRIAAPARVVSYAELERVLAAAGDGHAGH